jgi:hypothetical protein
MELKVEEGDDWIEERLEGIQSHVKSKRALVVSHSRLSKKTSLWTRGKWEDEPWISRARYSIAGFIIHRSS